MSDIIFEASEQMSRVNARIAELAADYARSQMTRDAWLRAGQFRGAREMTKRLRLLDTELAYLARQRREWIVVNCMGRMAH